MSTPYEPGVKTLGRKIRPMTGKASSEALKTGALFNDALHRLPTGDTTHFPKGVYRYASHEEANRHWEECVIKGMAAHARRVQSTSFD